MAAPRIQNLAPCLPFYASGLRRLTDHVLPEQAQNKSKNEMPIPQETGSLAGGKPQKHPASEDRRILSISSQIRLNPGLTNK
jgi:hypothetical protein